MEEIFKKHSDWLRDIYKLKYWDLFEYLEIMKREADKKKIFIGKLPMGLKDYVDVIRFRCYNNDILNVMIKNKNIDIETTKNQLKFIDEYEKYLADKWDVKDCENQKKMLQNNLNHLDEEIQFLNELLK